MTSGRRLEALMDAMGQTPMTGNQRYVVLCLSRYADHKTGRNARPGLRTLAKDAGCKVDTAQHALARAEEFGIIAAEHRNPGRATTWTVLPEPSPQSGQQAYAGSGQHRPPTVPPPSRNGDTTTETTGFSETSPQDETSASTHTPTTNGEAGGEPDPLSDLTPEARAFALDLGALACTKAASRLELCDLADIAEYGSRNKYGHVTARQFFDAARDKRIRSMDRHAPSIFAEAAKYGIGSVGF